MTAGCVSYTHRALCAWADAWSASGREALGVWSDAGGVYIVPVADVQLPPEADTDTDTDEESDDDDE